SMLVVAARGLANLFDEGVLHNPVGQVDGYPNSPVVVASHAELLLDLRSPDAAVITAAEEALFGRIAEIEELAGVQIRMTSEHKWDVNPYSEGGGKLWRSVAEELELSHGEVMTVAGHDSTNMKDTTPTVMLFVPSVRGISHSVREY